MHEFISIEWVYSDLRAALELAVDHLVTVSSKHQLDKAKANGEVKNGKLNAYSSDDESVQVVYVHEYMSRAHL